jgi:hypothetical protein
MILNLELEPENADILFTITDKDLNIISDCFILLDTIEMITDDGGEVFCNGLDQGVKYSYTAKKEGYQTYIGQFIADSTYQEIAVALDEIHFDVSIKVFDNMGPVVGAEIFFNDTSDFTDDLGVALFKVGFSSNPLSLLIKDEADHLDYMDTIVVTENMVIVVYLSPLGFDGIKQKNLVMYPNPTNDVVTISSGNGMTLGYLMIFNTNGTLVYERVISTDEAAIDLSNYSSGMYLFKVIQEDGVFFHRVVKNRP